VINRFDSAVGRVFNAIKVSVLYGGVGLPNAYFPRVLSVLSGIKRNDFHVWRDMPEAKAGNTSATAFTVNTVIKLTVKRNDWHRFIPVVWQ
jgi:hypothetical protein